MQQIQVKALHVFKTENLFFIAHFVPFFTHLTLRVYSFTLFNRTFVFLVIPLLQLLVNSIMTFKNAFLHSPFFKAGS